MPPSSSFQRRHHIRVVLSSTALLPFLSVRKAAALAIAQLGVAAFFISGVTRSALGESAGWFVVAATIVTIAVRAIDIESWALLVPGGFTSRVRLAFGHKAGRFAAALAIVERMLMGALACVLIGHYTAGVTVTAIAGWRFSRYVTQEDPATLLAAAAIGILWIRARIGRDIRRDTIATAVWSGIAILTVTVIWGVLTLAFGAGARARRSIQPPCRPRSPAGRSSTLCWSVSSGSPLHFRSLAAATCWHGPPTIYRRRACRGCDAPRFLATAFAFVIAALGTWLFIRLVPAGDLELWMNAPLAGLAQHLAGPGWLRDVMAVALASAAVLVLLPAVYGATADAERMLHRSSADGTLPAGLASLHTRFGTPARAVDITAAAMILVIVASSGRVAWLGRAYGVAIAVMLVLTTASLVRLRRSQPNAQRFRVPANLLVFGREVPLGLLVPGAIAGASMLAIVAARDTPSLVSAALIGALGIWFVIVGGKTETDRSG